MAWPFGERTAGVFLCVISMIWVLGARPLAASLQADSLQVLAREILDDTYQQELPSEADDAEVATLDLPEWLENILSSVSRLLLWILLFVAAILAGVWIAQRARRREADSRVPGPGTVAAPPARVDLADAEALARAGSYREALHVLLLCVIGRLRARMQASLADSLTSREILSRAGLSADARAAMRELVHSVERSHFGAFDTHDVDYQRCRGASRRVLDELARGET